MAKRRKRVGKSAAESPTSSCLLICDDVLTSLGKSKAIIQGVIDGITVNELPAVIGPLCAYVRFSNVYASQKIRLIFTNASTDDEIFGFEAKSPPESDPLGVHTLILKIPPFEVDSVGRYIFSAVHNGVPFASSPILIRMPSHNTEEQP